MARFIKVYGIWYVLLIALTSYLGSALSGNKEEVLMPGSSTHGHYQIELDCTACHTKGMGVKQESCNECHAEELEMVDDSHPVIKFNDPRNTERLEHLDARYCITCHREHQPEISNPMALTLPTDYCYYCHQTIGEERPTHKDLPYNSCATAGCHNFHDNSALYERFLTDHLDEPDYKSPAFQKSRDFYTSYYKERGEPLEKDQADMPEDAEYTHRILFDWSTTAHANAGINCNDCHMIKDQASGITAWQNNPGYESCQTCHKHEVKGFLEGKHGMRLARDMSPMTPGMARLPMKLEAAHSELSCVSCHDSHRFDTRIASVESCLKCHNDDHSLAYKSSPHYQLFKKEEDGLGPKDSGVTCATCHMPRVERSQFGESFTVVDHNQNNSLRPNDKMIRSSCIQCHGLQFTLNALADTELINKNFQGLPTAFVESMEMAREEKERTENN